jgi:hypothetical protein
LKGSSRLKAKSVPTKRAATVLKVKVKTFFKRENGRHQDTGIARNGSWSRIIAFKMVNILRTQAVMATFFSLPLFTN